MSNHTIAQSAATIFGTAALTVFAYVAYRKISEAQKPKSLYERIGGEAAVNAVVGLFYERMLADPRVARFFTDTNMVKQHAKQVSFISYALGAPKKYAGVAMDVAHRRLIVQMGMNDSHFDATKENLLLTLKDAGVPQNLIEEVASVVESTREQVMCRGKWAIPDAERVRLVASMPKHEKTLFERIGGEAAVNTVVGKFYDRMLSDPRVSRFFKGTNMAKQHAKQVSFISYALGSPSKYAGLAMDVAHRKLIVQMGMDDSHFDATVENLLITLKEAGVPEPLINEVAVVVEGTREQVMCRGKWAISTEDRIKLAENAKKEEKSLYERIGGEAAVNAVVGLFYERMLSDPRVSRFFKDTNMSKQHAKQVSFISYALGSPKKYAGLAMDNAHRRLIKDMGMNDSHFDATKENLLTTLQEAGVPKDLRDEVDTVVESTREQVMCRGKWALPS